MGKNKIIIGIIYLLIVLIFLIFFFRYFSIDEITSYDFYKGNRDILIQFKEQSLIFTIIIFIFGVWAWVMLAGFGSPVVLFSGFLFGTYLGTILSTIALAFGATTFYLFANFFVKDLVENKFGKKFSYLKSFFEKNEFFYLFLYRLVGGIPFAISHVIPTIFNVKWKNFFFAHLGMVPQIYILSTIGNSISEIINTNDTPPSIMEIIFLPKIYLPILGFIVFILLSISVRKKIFKKG